MFLLIEDLLSADEVARVMAIANAASYQDGKVSNPHNKAKNNLQMEYGSPAFQQAAQIILPAVQRSGPFEDFAFPKRMTPPLVSKYEPGMTYGVHSDAAFVNVQPPLRSDLSMTIFLEDPANYDGGALRVNLGDKFVEVKEKPGTAIVYPSTSLHEVTPVTRGARIAAIAFIESHIKDHSKRDILWQIGEVAALEGENIAWENRTRLEYVKNNLRRVWDGE